ncbi:hypothetical protein Tco_1099330 [Tanacetum coccineum]
MEYCRGKMPGNICERVAEGMWRHKHWKLNTPTHLQASKRQGKFQLPFGLPFVIVIDLKKWEFKRLFFRLCYDKAEEEDWRVAEETRVVQAKAFLSSKIQRLLHYL